MTEAVTTETTSRKSGPDNPTEAQRSLAKYIREQKNFDITDAAVAASFTYHGEWQRSDERHAELQAYREKVKQDREAAREAGKAEAEEKRAAKEKEREEKRAAREADKAKKDEERKAKEVERESKRQEREAERAKKETEREERRKAAEEKRTAAETEREQKRQEREAKREAKETERAERSAKVAGNTGADGDDSTSTSTENGTQESGRKRLRRRGDEPAQSAASF
jgi:hypothetical protein